MLKETLKDSDKPDDQELLTHFQTKYTNRSFWTNEEKDKLFEGIELYGKNWLQIAKHIGSRDSGQVAAQAYQYGRNALMKKVKDSKVERKLNKLANKLSRSETGITHWSMKEKQKFEVALRKFGKDWDSITEFMQTRNRK